MNNRFIDWCAENLPVYIQPVYDGHKTIVDDMEGDQGFVLESGERLPPGSENGNVLFTPYRNTITGELYGGHQCETEAQCEITMRWALGRQGVIGVQATNRKTRDRYEWIKSPFCYCLLIEIDEDGYAVLGMNDDDGKLQQVGVSANIAPDDIAVGSIVKVKALGMKESGLFGAHVIESVSDIPLSTIPDALEAFDDADLMSVPFAVSKAASRPLLLFVGAHPSKTDLALRKPFSGKIGHVLKTRYLDPLSMSLDDVALGNVFDRPVNLWDTSDAMADVEHCKRMVKSVNARKVVALSKVAQRLLGDDVDYVLPHPTHVSKREVDQELDRKLARIRRELYDEDRGGTGLKKSEGRYVYQKRYYHLNTEHLDMTEEQLRRAGKRFYGDVRLELDDGKAWGFTLINDFPYSKVFLKKVHSDAWLDFEGIIPPGQVGATKNTYSKVFKVVDGKHKSDGDGNVTLDKTPWVVRNTGSAWVVEKPLVDVVIKRAEQNKRIVYGVVLDPNVIDAHNDWIPASEVEQTAHDWLVNSRTVSFDHRAPSSAVVVESWIEQYPSHADYLAAMANEPHKVYARKFGDDVVKSGSWIIGVQLTPELWEDFQNGKIQAFSIEGFGERNVVDVAEMPKVEVLEM